MKIRKMWGAFLMTLTAAGLLSGWQQEASVSEDGVVELTFYNADGQDDPWTDPVAEVLTEKTGVRLKTEYPVAADDQTVALMIAAQDYPDMIYAKGDANSLIDAGAMIDMTDLIEEYGPNIKKMYGDEFEKLRYSEEDPSIYQLSSYAVGGTFLENSGTAQIQWAALKENNYEIPDTLEEFEKMIKDYMAAHPTTEDGMPTIGISLTAADWHWMITLGNPSGYIAEGAPDNGQWLIDEDYNAMYKFRSDKVREYYRWLNRMYHEGVLDPEFATQTYEDYIAKIASGRVVALTDTDWDYSDGEKILIADGKLDKTYAGLPLAMDENTKAPSLMYQGLPTGQGVGITTSCKDPVAAIKFLDYLCSDEGQVLVNWGIEGVNYFIDEEGHRYRTQEEIDEANTNQDYSRITGVGFHSYPFPTYGIGEVDSTGSTYTTDSKETVIAEYNEEQKAACEAWGVELLVDVFPQTSEFEVPEYSPVWACMKPVEFDEIGNKLDEIAWSGLITCVISEESEFDAAYDNMLATLEGSGMSEAEAMLTDIVKDMVALSQ
ncbi:MAG TPA: extracellular solute-binding protein [Candidatus Enterocloster excrementigallinarum]|uniref:Extracellular solute-binding protein n=1 Tax=Candidatus Enterocloster excrementigallinarum TaxID=2838558 RepID=A0A9D2PSY4_9FIRM|nr:extracellular solute-binding protein [Candidatus Enterocloster excrementigallinarum]